MPFGFNLLWQFSRQSILCHSFLGMESDGIDCQWMTEDGKGLRGDTIPYDVTGDPELDYCAYYRAVENYLEAGQSHSDTD